MYLFFDFGRNERGRLDSPQAMLGRLYGNLMQEREQMCSHEALFPMTLPGGLVLHSAPVGCRCGGRIDRDDARFHLETDRQGRRILLTAGHCAQCQHVLMGYLRISPRGLIEIPSPFGWQRHALLTPQGVIIRQPQLH